MNQTLKYNFCTLFDSYYLSRGINLYNSLERNCLDFHLYIFAFDDNSYNILVSLGLKNATIISLIDFETEELLSVKSKRTISEYCWTCTASTISYSIEKFNLSHCTYLDADMMFFTKLDKIFNEIGDASVALTPHNFTNDLKQEEVYGKYCVQFVFFKNDKDGLMALNWWKQSCIDWCYATLEDKRYGDQKYLNFLAEKFTKVIDINNIGVGVAPWNINRFTVSRDKNNLLMEEKTNKNFQFPLIFFHYQGLEFTEYDNYIEAQASNIKIPNYILELIYTPYIQNISKINSELKGDKYKAKIINYRMSISTIIFRLIKKNIKKSRYLTNFFSKFKIFRFKKHKNIG